MQKSTIREINDSISRAAAPCVCTLQTVCERISPTSVWFFVSLHFGRSCGLVMTRINKTLGEKARARAHTRTERFVNINRTEVYVRVRV